MIFQSKQAFVQNQAEIISKSLEDVFELLIADDVARVMEYLDVAEALNVVITDANGKLLYGSSRNNMNDDFPPEEMEKAREGKDLFYAKFIDGSFFSSSLTPVVSKGAIIGLVYVYESDWEQGSILKNMQKTVGNISIIIIAFAFAMLLFIVRSVINRITSILNAIKTVREGEYNYHVEMSGKDELALLGDEFNSLTDRLRETDEIRQRFVANASHELRTPLASIRLLADSILQNEGMERDTMQEFISDIGTEAERLTRTTEKLMTLTRLDSGISDEKIKVNMGEAVAATLRMLRPLAMSGNLSIFESMEADCYVLATSDAIHQIVFNLIENAIKYNKPEGSVSISLFKENDDIVLNIDDTGVGVPEEDLSQIFDRFYRVDKARSREAGGSGLGLSIVRDSVRDLGGNVTAEPRVDGGMRFQVRFKQFNTPA